MDGGDMRIPNAVHEAHPWRIREIAHDFTLEDVWALPVHGGAGDLSEALSLLRTLDPAQADSLPARALWSLRDLLGKVFGLGRIATHEETVGEPPTPGTRDRSLAARLPADLRGTAADVDFGSVPFKPLYRTHDEFAAEVSNKTVH